MIIINKQKLYSIRFACLIFTALIINGCSSKVSSTIYKGGDTTPIEGVSYFLPTNNIRVVFTNSAIISEIKSTTKSLKAAETNEAKAMKVLQTAQKALAAGDSTKPDLIKKLKEAEVIAKKKVSDTTLKKLAAQKALDKAKETREQILVEVLPPIADTSQVYVAKLDHYATYDDSITLKTSSSGLLTQVIYKAVDQTGEIVQNLVKTGIEAAKIYARLHGIPIDPIPTAPVAVAGVAGAPVLRCTPYKDDTKEYYWEFTFDPSDQNKLALVNKQLIKTPLPFLINVNSPSSTFPLPSTLTETDNGIFYRRPLPYIIEILESEKEKEKLCKQLKDKVGNVAIKQVQDFIKKNKSNIPTSKSQQVEMAAGGPISWLRFDANSFVTTDISATFENGLLLDYKEGRPSGALGASRIPLEATKEVGNAIGSFISNILPIKIQWTNEQKELIQSETELLKARQATATELLESNTAFLKAQKDNVEAKEELLNK